VRAIENSHSRLARDRLSSTGRAAIGLEKSAVKTIRAVRWSSFVRWPAGCVEHCDCRIGKRAARQCIDPTSFQDVSLLIDVAELLCTLTSHPLDENRSSDMPICVSNALRWVSAGFAITMVGALLLAVSSWWQAAGG